MIRLKRNKVIKSFEGDAGEPFSKGSPAKKHQTMPNWTDAQRRAIEARGGDVLVSAAAGSGKTTALTERIIQRITEGGDIGRMLVVTFSRASAADMKKKISSALRKLSEEHPDDKNILRQLSRLGGAEIGTIHSFCSTLVRRHFAELGVPPGMRIPDDAETALLRSECMSDTLDFFYENDSGDKRGQAYDIVALADHLEGSGDGKMGKTLLSLYEKTSCLPRGFEAIGDSAEALERAGVRGFLDSSFGTHIKKRTSEGVDYYIGLMQAGLDTIAELDDFRDKYRAAFEASRDGLLRIKRDLDRGDYRAAAESIRAYDPPNFDKVRATKTERLEFLAKKKSDAKKFVEKIGRQFFSVSDEALERSIRRTAAVCRGIVRVLREFDRRYGAEKRRRGIVDYNDLERMAHRLLSDKNIAASVAAGYDDIYIDEYQDVNSVQDEIFAAIAHNNRFMVGDVKQSIYGFRGSDPKVFDAYRRKMDTIFMSDNFRCDEPIVEFTNAVCGVLMPCGNVSYDAEDALRHGKTDADVTYPVNIILTELDGEAEAIADTVGKLIADGVPASDIAILMRSAKEHAEVIAETLGRRGIKSANESKENFFECPEILFMMCLLHVCDNPLYDIYTAGALRSPAFGFDLDELTRLKAGDERPLFRVLRDGAEGTLPLDEALTSKCRDAYETICRWRESARLMSADEVIRMLYRETGVEALLWAESNRDDASETRASKLEALYDYARGYESGGFRGLHRFLSYIDSIVEGGVKSPVSGGGDVKSVHIMTVHSSKGLEFPVVILAGCGRGRNEKDAKGGVLWNAYAGAAAKLRADDNGESTVMVDTLPRRGVAEAVLYENMCEEMRILYVALTRAKERLYVTAGVGKPEKFVTEARIGADFFSPFTASSEKTFIGWILNSLFAHEKAVPGNDSFYNITVKTSGEEPEIDVTQDAPEAEERAETESALPPRERVEEYKSFIRERLSYRYPYERLGALPAKLSVSRLEPGILDEDATELVAMASAAEPNESALAGTATHIYMQFCDFEAAAHDAKAEGERLLSLGYITKEDLDRVRMDEVEGFFRSDIYARIREAQEVWRERRFNVRLPAAEFTENEADRELYRGEELLVQGVVDCFFREADGGIVLLDYKTDRLTAYERSHPAAAREKMQERHAHQLSYYRAALGKIFGTPPKETYVYSMHLGREIEID